MHFNLNLNRLSPFPANIVCPKNVLLLHLLHILMAFLYTLTMEANTIKSYQTAPYCLQYRLSKYSKTCVKQPLKNRQNKYLNDKW